MRSWVLLIALAPVLNAGCFLDLTGRWMVLAEDDGDEMDGIMDLVHSDDSIIGSMTLELYSSCEDL